MISQLYRFFGKSRLACIGWRSVSIKGLIVTGLALLCLPAVAGEPLPWQIGFQEAGSPVAAAITEFHNKIIMPIITGIVLLVVVLIIYICFRFSEKRNPVPSQRTHNRTLEIVWTLIPVIILGFIFIPSFYIMKMADHTDQADMTLKITGHQWYWSYEYPDHDNRAFDAYILADDELREGKRLLETDNPVILPVGKNIRLLLTASDVLHNWAVPALGVRIDTVPGRLNESWVRIERAGTYYGFCSELCGANHSYMPIEIKAVSEEEFAQWVNQKTALVSR